MESEKRMYTCAVCGKQYDNIKDRMNCERKCIEELTKKNEEAEKVKAKAEKAAKEKEILEAINKVYALLDEYSKKYSTTNTSTYNTYNPLLDNFLFRNFF